MVPSGLHSDGDLPARTACASPLGHARAISFSASLQLGAILWPQGEKMPPKQPQALQEEGVHPKSLIFYARRETTHN